MPSSFKSSIYCRVVRELEKFSHGPLHVRQWDTIFEGGTRERVKFWAAVNQMIYGFIPFSTPPTGVVPGQAYPGLKVCQIIVTCYYPNYSTELFP